MCYLRAVSGHQRSRVQLRNRTCICLSCYTKCSYGYRVDRVWVYDLSSRSICKSRIPMSHSRFFNTCTSITKSFVPGVEVEGGGDQCLEECCSILQGRFFYDIQLLKSIGYTEVTI